MLHKFITSIGFVNSQPFIFQPGSQKMSKQDISGFPGGGDGKKGFDGGVI